MRPLKYLFAFTLPVTAWWSFAHEGIWSFLPVAYAFFLLPLLEWFVGADPRNADAAQKEWMRKDPLYDILLYLTVPVQALTLFWFCRIVPDAAGDPLTLAGRISAMGMMCGVYGINVAHELGHRSSRWEQGLAKFMLATSLYMHFFIEHNRGHHRNVGTPGDPATARRGESLYAFWLRSVAGGLRSSWYIVVRERTRRKLPVWSLSNEWMAGMLVQLALVAVIFLWAGGLAAAGFVTAALIGILLLETVNYIEHYGLSRRKVSDHRYEDVEPWHSWNSDFIIGRLALFELTRHSDHHWQPATHYQLLDSMPRALQLPAGYPAMMLLSMAPPLWFRVMNPRLPAEA